MAAKDQAGTIEDRVLEIGTRLKSAPSRILIDSVFAWELNHQEHLFEAVGLADIAQTLVALEMHSIPEMEGRELLAQLLELQKKPESFAASPDRGDIYTNREAWLAQRCDAVGWLGAGRARREAITTAFVLVMRMEVLNLIEALAVLGQTMTDSANAHKLAIMPDYTYLQAAQPTTFGHYLLGFTYPLLRDIERLELLFTQLNRSPMGCGSTNGSRIPQGRKQLARLLGFADVISHARDAMWQADLFMECSAILSACSINLSRLAEDLQIFGTREFGLIELDDSHARASKIMPQKKNPFAFTHIRAVANKMIGLTATVAASARTPSGQPDNRQLIYGELPEAMRLITNAAALMTEVLEHIRFKAARGKQLVETGWAMATDLAETLVTECGLDFRSAHHLTAYLAGEYQDRSILDLDRSALIAVGQQLLGQDIEISEEQLQMALNPDDAIQARSEPGGTASLCMDGMINECREFIGRCREKNRTRKIYLEAKQDELLQLAGALARL